MSKPDLSLFRPESNKENVDEEDVHVEAILAHSFEAPKKNPKPTVKKELSDQIENIKLKPQGEQMVSGNAQGLRVLEKLEKQDQELAALKADFAASKADSAALKADFAASKADSAAFKAEVSANSSKIDSLNKKVSELTRNAEAFLKIRMRVFQNYEKAMRRDYDQTAILLGNSAAHDGDALADAALLKHFPLLEEKLYEEIYGIVYHRVNEYYSETKDESFIEILNQYASLKLQAQPMKPELEEAYRKFLTAMFTEWLQTPLQSPSSPLAGTYYNVKSKVEAETALRAMQRRRQGNRLSLN